MSSTGIKVPAWCVNDGSSPSHTPTIPCEIPASSVKDLYLLNGMVVPRRLIQVWGYAITASKAAEIIKAVVSSGGKIHSYIGHQSTAQLLTQEFGIDIPMNRGEYEPKQGDIAMLVRLLKRTPKPGIDVDKLTIDDLLFDVYSYG